MTATPTKPPVVYLLRHGYRIDWDDPLFVSMTGRPHDPPLSRSGLLQAKEAAEHLKRTPGGQEIKKIYSSPYCRTVQTAEKVAERLGLEICLEEGLSEFYGNSVKDVLPTPASVSLLSSLFKRIDPTYVSVAKPPADGFAETKVEFHDRLRVTMKRLLEESTPPSRSTGFSARAILCVTHAAGVIAAARAVLDDANASVRSPAAGMVKLVPYPDQTEAGKGGCGWKYRIEENGRTDYLTSGELRNWWFPDEVPKYE